VGVGGNTCYDQVADAAKPATSKCASTGRPARVQVRATPSSCKTCPCVMLKDMLPGGCCQLRGLAVNACLASLTASHPDLSMTQTAAQVQFCSCAVHDAKHHLEGCPGSAWQHLFGRGAGAPARRPCAAPPRPAGAGRAQAARAAPWRAWSAGCCGTGGCWSPRTRSRCTASSTTSSCTAAPARRRAPGPGGVVEMIYQPY